MLADALVERYSRQILLPEVGGRGQERLCAARLVVTGDNEAAHVAADLLRAAGAGVTVEPGPRGAVGVDVGADAHVAARWHASAARVALLTARPCPRCVPPETLVLPAAADAGAAAPVAVATGALVAMETIRALLGLAPHGLVHALDLGRGTFAGRALDGPGCAACGGSA